MRTTKMKKLLTIMMIFVCAALTAEYQAFDFRASIKTLKFNQIVENKEQVPSWCYSSDTLKGILVTVCCYPCNASMGKSYPSWLYVIRGKDTTRTLFKIPVRVDGGILGKSVNIEKISDIDQIERWDLSKADKNYVKKANQAWMTIEFDTSRIIPVILKGKKYNVYTDMRSIWYECPERI